MLNCCENPAWKRPRRGQLTKVFVAEIASLSAQVLELFPSHRQVIGISLSKWDRVDEGYEGAQADNQFAESHREEPQRRQGKPRIRVPPRIDRIGADGLDTKKCSLQKQASTVFRNGRVRGAVIMG